MDQATHAIEQIYANDALGTYYVDRYYFSIRTNKTRKQAGFKDSETPAGMGSELKAMWFRANDKDIYFTPAR